MSNTNIAVESTYSTFPHCLLCCFRLFSVHCSFLPYALPILRGAPRLHADRGRGGDRRAVRRLDRLEGRDHGGGAAGLDRKSTRLNSSHLVISYAGFCMKKKRAIYNCFRCVLPERHAVC